MEHKFKIGDRARNINTNAWSSTLTNHNTDFGVLGKKGTIIEVGVSEFTRNEVVVIKWDDGGICGKEACCLELISSLPEKWAVKGCKTLEQNINKVFKNPRLWTGDGDTLYYFRLGNEWECEEYLPTGHTIITEEQFKQIVEKGLNKTEMKTYKVTREQLAEIYSIACLGWKPKIEKITNDALGAFGTEGELSEEIVQYMRDAATTEQRPVIDRIFPKPKKIVTKEAVGYVNIYKGGTFGVVHETKEDAIAINIGDAIVIAHEIRIPYEVEEEC